MRCSRSSRVSAPGSPVVPATTTPWLPLSICHSMRSTKRESSSWPLRNGVTTGTREPRSEEHTSELQSQSNLVCRLLLEKKKKQAHNEQDAYAYIVCHRSP